MNKTFLALTALTLLTLTGLLILNNDSKKNDFNYESEFLKFNQKFKKTYSNLKDKSLRFEIFKKNFDLISNHKNKSYSLEINKFADLSFEEFKTYYLTDMSKVHPIFLDKMSSPKIIKTASSIDWNKMGKVQRVKNQASCGSCWAFSAIGALESAFAIKENNLYDLSEQELVDCSNVYGNAGCNGGLMSNAFSYILDNNIHNESDYEYTAVDGDCRVPEIGHGEIHIERQVQVQADVDGLTEALNFGPVSVAFSVQDDFRFYQSGVYNPSDCFGSVNHGVLAFGYNLDAEIPYFSVKNSWGTDWGNQGLFDIAQGNNDGTCNIAGNGFNCYPVV